MDSRESPTYGEQEGSAYNGHFGCTCYHPLFVFNQLGDVERCALRSGNVHSPVEQLLLPVVDLIRVNPERARQLGDRPVALDRRQRHLRLERRLVFLPCPLHVLLPRHRRFLGAGLHLSQLSHFRGPAHCDRRTATVWRVLLSARRRSSSAFDPRRLAPLLSRPLEGWPARQKQHVRASIITTGDRLKKISSQGYSPGGLRSADKVNHVDPP
jgi:hypothetical protein